MEVLGAFIGLFLLWLRLAWEEFATAPVYVQISVLLMVAFSIIGFRELFTGKGEDGDNPG